MNDEVTITVRVDGTDLGRHIAAGINAALAQAGIGPMPGSAASGGGTSGGGGGGGGGVRAGQRNANDPSFGSIFRPVAAANMMEKLLTGLLRNSQIANAYMSGMGKVFGAAIDLLLIPFIPLFNLLMVGVSKLVAWLITSGTLAKIQAAVERGTKYLEAVASWIGKVFTAIKDLDFAKFAQLIVTGITAALKEFIKNPIAAAGGVLGAVAAGGIGYGILNMASGGLLGKGIGLGAKGLGGLFSMGRTAIGSGGAGGGVVEGAGAAGGGGAAGGMSLMGLAGKMIGPTLLAGSVGFGTSYLASKAGIHGTANATLTGAAAGATFGAAFGGIGAIPGALIGGTAGYIGSKLGLFGGGGKQQQQAAGAGAVNSSVNSYNTLNATVNVMVTDKTLAKQVSDDVLQQWQQKTGFKLQTRS